MTYNNSHLDDRLSLMLTETNIFHILNGNIQLMIMGQHALDFPVFIMSSFVFIRDLRDICDSSSN